MPPPFVFADPSVFSLPYFHPILPHPDSPAAKTITVIDVREVDYWERVECALEAIGMAPASFGYWLFFETGQSLEGVAESVAPVLCAAVFVLGLSTVAGAGACGAVGLLGGPGLAAEFASLGARGGFREGMVLLEWLGIGAMAVYLADNIDRSLSLGIRGARRAWHAPDHGDEHFEINEVRNGADDLAHSAAVLLRLLLEALVAGLLAEGASAAASRLPKLMRMLRESRLGKGFAAWFEKNWKTLVDDPRFRPKPRATEGGGAGKGGGLGADGDVTAGSKGPQKTTRRATSKSDPPPAESSPTLAKTKPAKVGPKASKLWSSTKKMSSTENAHAHWVKHGQEFPELQNSNQYVAAARQFVNKPPAGTLSKLRPNGDTVLYNASTNTFAVKNADGVPKTMFKPSGNGLAYFNAQ